MIKMLIAGDFVFPSDPSLINSDSYCCRFGEIMKIIADSDYSIINLESPIIETTPTPIKKSGPNLRSNAEAINLINFLGFKGVTLANNHFYDQGEKGVKDTINRCKAFSIDYFGAGFNLEDAAKTHYISIKDKIVAIINCCEIEFSIASAQHGGSNPLNPISQYYAINEAKSKADFVVVIVHGGIEHFQYPTMRMQQTYRFFVDAGANAVINHHQHCYSGYEIYNGAPIIYGLGNFFFPRFKYSNTFWNIGYLVKLLFDHSIRVEIYPYNQCSDNYGIELLKGDLKNEFDSKIKIINAVIQNQEELEQANIKFMNSSLSSYDWLFQPYDNKLLKALANRGLIPKLLSQPKLNEIMSLVNCQSHFDRFNYYLRLRTSMDL